VDKARVLLPVVAVVAVAPAHIREGHSDGEVLCDIHRTADHPVVQAAGFRDRSQLSHIVLDGADEQTGVRIGVRKLQLLGKRDILRIARAIGAQVCTMLLTGL